MRQELLFSAEFAKRQYYLLYNTTGIQGHLPHPVYPEILFFVKSEIEKLAVNDPVSLVVFLTGLNACLKYVKDTQVVEGEGAYDSGLRAIFHGNLLQVYKAIVRFIENTYPAFELSKRTFSNAELPVFTREMKKPVPCEEEYVATTLRSAIVRVSQ